MDGHLTTILDRLQAALASRFALERELGRGGMATVYLAQDLRYRRPVALKVLHPELAATVGPERFLREIQVTAKLDHPHILPMLESGEADDLLWYAMPYVAGESLRERLRREVQLPVDEAVRIAREVADGLDCAHRHLVVHRDIKPENILLSEGHARVADFGVAQALEGAGGDRLTGTGLAIGTPLYMSPEQSGSGELDGRSDQYSLGCVLFEMLAGEPPFTGRTPQSIVAKRLSGAAPAVRRLRPSVPYGIEAALARALAQVPADRFATMGELAAALQSPEADDRARRRPPTHMVALYALTALAVLGMLYVLPSALRLPARGIGPVASLSGAGMLPQRERILIADFQDFTPDSQLGEVVTAALRIDMAQSPVVSILPPPLVTEALVRMQRPARARLDATVAREIAVREGAKAVLTGDVAVLGARYVLSAQLLSAQDGEVLVAWRETADDSTELIETVDRLSARLRERIGESLRTIRGEPPLERVTTASLGALRKYVQANNAADHEGDNEKAIALLQSAIALDSGFAMAYRSMGTILGNSGAEWERIAEAYRSALEHRDRLTERERHQMLGDYYSQVLSDPEKASAAFRSLLESHPDDWVALNNLGVVYRNQGDYARADPLFQRTVTLDSLSWPPHWNLVWTRAGLGRHAEAQASLDWLLRRVPENPQVGWVSILLPSAQGNYNDAETRARAFVERHAANAPWRATGNVELAHLALVRGKVEQGEQHLREAMEAEAEAGSAAARLNGAVSLATSTVRFRGQRARGLDQVEAALARYPLSSLRPRDRPYLALARLYAELGRPARARELLAEEERVLRPEERRPRAPTRHLARGGVAMAERRFEDAAADFRKPKGLEDLCVPCGLALLARAYDSLGQHDSAIAIHERYLVSHELLRIRSDAFYLAGSLRRLGELYEGRGDRERARQYYSRFVKLWEECDPELRPTVAEVRHRLAKLARRMSAHSGIQPRLSAAAPRARRVAGPRGHR